MRHINPKQKSLIIPTSSHSSKKIEELIDSVTRSLLPTHDKNFIISFFSKLKDDGLDATYIKWSNASCGLSLSVGYNWNLKIPHPNGILEYELTCGKSIKYHDCLFSVIQTLQNPRIDWSWEVKKLTDDVIESYLYPINKNIFDENIEFYKNSLDKLAANKLKAKANSYPAKLGKVLSEYEIDDKELLIRLLKYLKTPNGSTKLEKVVKYMGRLDVSILSDEIIDKAVDIAIINDILK